MIAFASRYGHQPLVVAMFGDDMTGDRLSMFNDGLQFWIAAEHKNGRASAMNWADGG